MRKIAAGAENFEIEAVETCVKSRIIDISERNGINIGGFMQPRENREAFKSYLCREREDRKEAVIKRKKLISNIIKTVLWSIFLSVWGSCLIMGSLAGLVAVAVGIIVSVAVSI